VIAEAAEAPAGVTAAVASMIAAMSHDGLLIPGTL